MRAFTFKGLDLTATFAQVRERLTADGYIERPGLPGYAHYQVNGDSVHTVDVTPDLRGGVADITIYYLGETRDELLSLFRAKYGEPTTSGKRAEGREQVAFYVWCRASRAAAKEARFWCADRGDVLELMLQTVPQPWTLVSLPLTSVRLSNEARLAAKFRSDTQRRNPDF